MTLIFISNGRVFKLCNYHIINFHRRNLMLPPLSYKYEMQSIAWFIVYQNKLSTVFFKKKISLFQDMFKLFCFSLFIL